MLFVADGRLRPIWRAVIYFAIGTWALTPLSDRLYPVLQQALRLRPGFSAGNIALGETQLFVVALVCTGILGSYERRRVDSYGLSLQRALGAHTWEGAACGVIMAGAVALGMLALGGNKIHGSRSHGERCLAQWASVARGKHLHWSCGGVLVSILPPADAVERTRLLARRDHRCADFRSRSLLLQVRGEHLGCDNARFSKPSCLVLRASDRYIVVRGRLPCRVRLYANLHHRYAERIASSCRSSTRCDLSRAGVAHRRCSWYRDEFSDVSDDRIAMDVHLVAVPWTTGLIPGIVASTTR
jgi:hypothetical protein